MKIVIVNIAREEGGFCYTLVRVLRDDLELMRMQIEYPFPLIVQTFENITEEEFKSKFKSFTVEQDEEWYYAYPSLRDWLKKGGTG